METFNKFIFKRLAYTQVYVCVGANIAIKGDNSSLYSIY